MARYRVLDYSINTTDNSILLPGLNCTPDNVILVTDETQWPVIGAKKAILRSSGNITHTQVSGDTIYVDSGWCVLQTGDDLRVEVDFGNDADNEALAKTGSDSGVTLTTLKEQLSGASLDLSTLAKQGSDSGVTLTNTDLKLGYAMEELSGLVGGGGVYVDSGISSDINEIKLYQIDLDEKFDETIAIGGSIPARWDQYLVFKQDFIDKYITE